MSERILRALMQLFAIIAKVDDISDEKETPIIQSTKGRLIIESFLKSELSSSDVENYIEFFEEFLAETHGKMLTKNRDQKRTSLQSVKILRICDQINKELTQRQKVIVLIRIFEFIGRDDEISDMELKFIETVAESFHIKDHEFNNIKNFTKEDGKLFVDSPEHIYYCANEVPILKNAVAEVIDGLDATIHVLHVKSVKTLFFRYFGKDELYINGQISNSNRTHVFNIGSTLRTGKSAQLFYSDLISKLLNEQISSPISMEVEHVSLKFKSGGDAVKNIHFSTASGNLVGIMGGSGTGKTTLLNILNGRLEPSKGRVLINGIDLHKKPKTLEGVIGYVDQNDVLNDELTVFQNLYFSAKLSMGGLDKKQIIRKVADLLKTLGLYDIRYLKVGTVFEKVISGGQRKRLNIALELIREPSILFIDEPTSGLSSRDSDNIIDLLKELALKGKLIYAVIHQPSSNIFKLFDRLIIMDQGGLPIYNGIPMNAIVHFKTHSFKGNAHERECSLCGNVNPEQIFNIIDAKIVDEFGNETNIRKKTPADWNEIHRKHRVEALSVKKESTAPESKVKLPGLFIQFKTYLIRDVLSKFANLQYVLVNLLIAPLLSLVLSYFIKYFNWKEQTLNYTFYDNENIPQYLFIIVIVSIFLGLTVAAEEIHRDKKIISRERFIRLSRSSYLVSKIALLFSISAFQSLLFVIIGNSILEIKGMWFEFWLIMFTTSSFSNLLGLVISSTFNSAKVIYIVIPLIIIPQLLFSGVIVKFDKLHPSLSTATKVPWIGNLMVSRWSYEALAVEQATQNKFERNFLKLEISKSNAEWKKDYWSQEIKQQIRNLDSKNNAIKKEAAEILQREIQLEEAYWTNLKCIDCYWTKGNITKFDEHKIQAFLYKARTQYSSFIAQDNKFIDAKIDEIGKEKYIELERDYVNNALMMVVTNKMEVDKLIIDKDQIYRNDNPIYNLPKNVSFLGSHFYAPYKYIFGNKISTYHANILFIWLMSIFMYALLYFDAFKVALSWILRIVRK
ncbi:MAG: ATP-binding cassette domain-containing protein [Crocinitomicaceae bacterium]